MKKLENAKEVLGNFVESEKVKRVYDAMVIGVSNDNIVIVDTFLQNIMTMLFLEMPKLVEKEDDDFKENSPKVESIKKFLSGADKRYGVGLDLVCNYILKNRRMYFKMQALAVNENANTIKFMDDKELEYAPVDEIKAVYNEFLTELSKFFDCDALNSIKL